MVLKAKSAVRQMDRLQASRVSVSEFRRKVWVGGG